MKLSDIIRNIKSQYSKGGLGMVVIQIYRYVLLYSFLSSLLRRVLTDVLHEKLVRSVTIGYWPNIKNPRTFNEKTMYRKIYTDKDIFTTLADKYKVNQYVYEKLADNLLPEVYQVIQDPAEIDFEKLPESFVMKATHGTGKNKIVRDKNEFSRDDICRYCQRWLTEPHPKASKEYWYNDIERKIIFEELLTGKDQKIPRDYKIMVFNGKAEYVLVDVDRFGSHKRSVYDRNWNKKDLRIYAPDGGDIARPENLDEMISVAEKLGNDFDFIRVDLYNTASHGVVFGELTMAHGSGGERFTPKKYDNKFGEKWDQR